MSETHIKIWNDLVARGIIAQDGTTTYRKAEAANKKTYVDALYNADPTYNKQLLTSIIADFLRPHGTPHPDGHAMRIIVRDSKKTGPAIAKKTVDITDMPDLDPEDVGQSISEEELYHESLKVIEASGDVLFYHPESDKVLKVDEQTHQRYLAHLYRADTDKVGEWLDARVQRVSHTTFDYRTDKRFFRDGGRAVFNLYTPPKFRNQFKQNKLPDIVKKHLNLMLTPKEEDLPDLRANFGWTPDCIRQSATYILDWCANSIRVGQRNIPWLLLIGEGGAGKGSFAELMISVHNGEHLSKWSGKNYPDLYAYSDKKGFGHSDFNAEYAGKRLICFDEFEMITQDQIRAQKTFADATIQVEKKGLDKRSQINGINFLAMSNKLNAVTLEHNQRRISWIDIYGADLKQIMSVDELDDHLNKLRASWEQFGYYLLHREIVHKNIATTPYVTPRGEMLADGSKLGYLRVINAWAESPHEKQAEKLDDFLDRNEQRIPRSVTQNKIMADFKQFSPKNWKIIINNGVWYLESLVDKSNQEILSGRIKGPV